jgi:hypothetical protein
MKMTIFTTLIILSNTAFALSSGERAEKSWSFKYKASKSQSFQIQKKAASFEDAFKAAAKDCYKQMTQGKYPGEEKGLEIIDICATENLWVYLNQSPNF